MDFSGHIGIHVPHCFHLMFCKILDENQRRLHLEYFIYQGSSCCCCSPSRFVISYYTTISSLLFLLRRKELVLSLEPKLLYNDYKFSCNYSISWVHLQITINPSSNRWTIGQAAIVTSVASATSIKIVATNANQHAFSTKSFPALKTMRSALSYQTKETLSHWTSQLLSSDERRHPVCKVPHSNKMTIPSMQSPFQRKKATKTLQGSTNKYNLPRIINQVEKFYHRVVFVAGHCNTANSNTRSTGRSVTIVERKTFLHQYMKNRPRQLEVYTTK